MAKEVFHIMREEGRYKHGILATSSATGAITMEPHSTDHMGSGMTIDEAVQGAVSIKKADYHDRQVTLNFNERAIPISDNANTADLVAGFKQDRFPRTPPSQHRE